MDERRRSIQKLLRPTDTCLFVVCGRLLGLQSPAERVCVLIKHEGREERGLILFSVDRLVSPPTCSVDSVHPIRSGFTAQTQVIRGGYCQLLVATGDGSSLVLELPQDQFTPIFISQLQRAGQLSVHSPLSDSASSFRWLEGYERCHSGWDRFAKPCPPNTSEPPRPLFLLGSNGERVRGREGEGPPLGSAFPEKWPWSHIITPNQDGSTDVATCETYRHGKTDLSEFDPLCQLPNNAMPTSMPPATHAVDIMVTHPTTNPTPSDFHVATTDFHTPPSNNPFHSPVEKPFTSPRTSPSPCPPPFPHSSSSPSPTLLPPPPPPPSSLVPPPPVSTATLRGCISDTNLFSLQSEGKTRAITTEQPLMTRSQENLAAPEGERHCVAMDNHSLRLVDSEEYLSGSGREADEGEVEEVEGGRERRRRGTKPLKRREKTTVVTGRPYSQFEVISKSEIERAGGRRGEREEGGGRGRTGEREEERGGGRERFHGSPEMNNLRRSRASVLRNLAPTGPRASLSKARMESPELGRKQFRGLKRGRSATVVKGHSGWVSRYRPGVSVPMTSARESIVQAELREREREFCTLIQLRVFCGTWNVNGKSSPSSLDQFLLEFDGQGEQEGGVAPIPDIFAIGFQEMDLSAQALIGGESSKEDIWISSVEQTLLQAASYHKLCSIRMVGVMLLVYIRTPLLEVVSDVSTELVTTGIGGILGNKGGVAARFNIYHNSLCFVNCHFAASMEEVDKRNQDYYTIRNKMVFDKVSDYKYSIMEHDMVFWIGDMNYRIQTSPEMTVDVIKAHADNFQITSLLLRDQLVTEMTRGVIFNEFAEGAINFKPTYKYDPNTDQWDTSEKHRPPAWCDRVLYYGVGVELRGYRSHPKMKISDHKPVSAVFDCNVKVVDPLLEREILEDITRKLDKLENDTLPQVDLSAIEFVFTNVKFQIPQCRRLTVTNTGTRPVLVSFIPKLDQERYCKPWLDAKPSSAVVRPLEDVIVVLTGCVDCDSASALNNGEDKFEDILVLHLEGGKDFFISVSGNYVVSCFGSSLETLVHLHTYIREVPVAELLDLSLTASWDTCSLRIPRSSTPSSSLQPSSSVPSSSSLHTTPALDLPKELYRMVDYLLQKGLKQESLFQERGHEVEMQEIREVLDRGGRDLPGTPHSVAASLLLFLSALEEPVIPHALHQRAMDCCSQPLLCRQLLLQLPRVHQRSFVFLVSFMKQLLRFSEDNGLDAKVLATIFGGVLLYIRLSERRTKTKKQLDPHNRKKATFVYQFLVNDLTTDYR